MASCYFCCCKTSEISGDNQISQPYKKCFISVCLTNSILTFNPFNTTHFIRNGSPQQSLQKKTCAVVYQQSFFWFTKLKVRRGNLEPLYLPSAGRLSSCTVCQCSPPTPTSSGDLPTLHSLCLPKCTCHTGLCTFHKYTKLCTVYWSAQ